ncbi:hypothetical protein M440DRAFT_1001074 [Trichoderma longibrachiatum ATCC 18648]|uniref:Uncharacterized protein n=1 Tax=Trichoderma longibrachiatum ATCC 18648 TaxID=983965 RepID=A0A2T4CH54_TRILO|nr:hypothetical protein M440DRAFT_1001074 [Trichoderma longibrachiatum ATCC 18648]
MLDLPFHWLHLLTETKPLPSVTSTSKLDRQPELSIIQQSSPNPCSNRVRLCKQRQQTAASIITYHHILLLLATSSDRTSGRLCICFAARPLWIDTSVESLCGLDKTEIRAGRRLQLLWALHPLDGGRSELVCLSCPHLAKPRLGRSTLILRPPFQAVPLRHTRFIHTHR